MLMFDRVDKSVYAGGGEDGEGDILYSFFSGNMVMKAITNTGMVRNTEIIYMDSSTTPDDYTNTSYFPTDEEIDAILNAL